MKGVRTHLSQAEWDQMMQRKSVSISKAKTRHGHALGNQSPTYTAWVSMKRRCSHKASPKDKAIYFDRGIRVCERWMTFENFLADMGERPGQKFSIDRINNDMGYEPNNCRWATLVEQQRNKNNSTKWELNGVVKSPQEWSEIYGIHRETIRRRIQRGWDVERAIKEPLPLAGKGSAWRKK